MKKLFLLAASFLLATPFAHAATKQNGTFTCISGLSLPLDSFYLELPSPGVSTAFVTVTTDTTQFMPLIQDVLSGRLDDTCQVQLTTKKTDATSPALKFIDVALALVSVTGDKDSQYVTATFNFARLEDLATSSGASTKSATPLTPDQKNKALTQFLARAPKPSAN